MMLSSKLREEYATLVLTELKQNVIPWKNNTLPVNPATGKVFTGINQILLQTLACRRKYQSHYWATYHQWQSLNCKLQKKPEQLVISEWAAPLILWKPFDKLSQKDGAFQLEHFHAAEIKQVYNAEQVFGLNIGEYIRPLSLITEFDYSGVQELVEYTRAEINYGFDSPYYDRFLDLICLPDKSRFISEKQFHATQLHELIHWCERRTQWEGPDHQAELVAEIGAATLENHLKIPHCDDLTNHHMYLPVWQENITKNPQYLFTAAAQAAKAVDYVLGFKRIRTLQP